MMKKDDEAYFWLGIGLRMDWLGFNGTFGINRLYRASEKCVAVKKVKLMRKLTMVRTDNTYNKPLQK